MYVTANDIVVPLRGQDELAEFCKENRILSKWFAPKFIYRGIGVDQPTMCLMIGYIKGEAYGDIAVLDVNGQNIKINPTYLDEMQPSKKMMKAILELEVWPKQVSMC